MLKLFLIAAVCTLGIFQTAQAARSESLDIGGIDLYLGEDLNKALRSLSIVYEVKSIGQGLWNVRQKNVNGYYDFFGTFSISKGIIISISKSFPMSVPEDAFTVYNSAYKQLLNLGGKKCKTSQSQYGGSIWGFDTHCGHYTLSFIIPSMSGSNRVLPGVSLSLDSK